MEPVVIVLLLAVLGLVAGHLIARWTWPMRAQRWRRRAYIVEYEARHTPDSGLEEAVDTPAEPVDPPPRLLDDEERQRRRAAGRTPEDLDY